MKRVIKGAIIALLTLTFVCTSLISVYVSVSLSQEVSRSNTLLYKRLSDLERLSERGIIPQISIHKSPYEGGNEIVLWDFWDFVDTVKTKNSNEVFFQESYYAFPATVIYAKMWIIVGQTKYVFNLY